VIEVNLLPGGKKKGGGSGFSVGALIESVKGLTSGGAGGAGGAMSVDMYVAFFVGAAVISLGYMGMTFLGVQGDTEELNVSVEAAVQDSIRNAAIIQRTNELQARGDSIQQRVAIIQEIDAGRYTWPHLLDEIAAAVPDFTWLREVLYQSDGPLQVRVTGRAGSIFAITQFMRRLEASRFLRAVQTETIQEVPSEANSDDLVFMFELSLTYGGPPLDELQTVPLFGDAASQAQIADPGN
jgi:Tfp pilus assembly protein PilN